MTWLELRPETRQVLLDYLERMAGALGVKLIIKIEEEK
jgi:hypothetical protein